MDTVAKFERGQLILSPHKDDLILWMVTSVARNGKAKMTAHLGSLIMDVTTSVDTIPDNWRVWSNAEAVKALSASG